MLESLLLGAIQGVAEWLPISSEGAVILVKENFFSNGETLLNLIEFSLFLHLGTFLAALVYFRKDVARITEALLRPRRASAENRTVMRFLVVATLVSALVGGGLLFFAQEAFSEATGRGLMALIGLMLFVTAALQWKKRRGGVRRQGDMTTLDGLLLGFAQGFTVIPGLSRSGTTVALLLLRGVREEDALKLSFLMSLPVVLGANIVLNIDGLLNLSVNTLVALAASFVFGLATVHWLMKFASRINFASFVLFFAILSLLAALL